MIHDEVIIDNTQMARCAMFIESFLQIPFRSTLRNVHEMIDKLNDIYAKNGSASLHDLYVLLNLPEVSLTRDFGWSEYLGSELGYDWIHVGLKRDVYNNEETYTLTYRFEPLVGFNS